MPDLERRPVPIASKEEEGLLREAAAQYGVEVQEPAGRALDPISALILVGAAGAVAGAINYFFDRRKGGQVIDMRPDAKDPVYRDDGLMYGLILIIATDGKVTVEVKEPKNSFGQIVSEVIEAVGNVATKTAEALANGRKAVFPSGTLG